MDEGAGVSSLNSVSKLAEGREEEEHTALGDHSGGLGECHAGSVFRDRVRCIALP